MDEVIDKSAAWTASRKNELAAKKRKRRINVHIIAHPVPFCGYSLDFYPAVSSVVPPPDLGGYKGGDARGPELWAKLGTWILGIH